MTGLYVHIPFCEKKCHYCDFAVTTDRSAEMRQRFFSALRCEAEKARAKYGRFLFDTLYLGGGTPSAVSAAETEALVSHLRGLFDFAPDFEFTLEMNPGDAQPEKLRAYRRLGVNRVSLGVQAFQPELLRAMGRSHGVPEIAATARLLREAGFENVSMDLMFRLPGQTPAHFEESLRRALDLGPAQITAYDLEVLDATAFGKRKKRGALDLPDEDAHHAMFALAEKILRGAGYRQYELASFARPGFECRHNLIYWKGEDYLGLGPGAVSFLRGARTRVAADVASYLAKVEQGNPGLDAEDKLTPAEREMERLITGLRLEEGISLEEFPSLALRVRELFDFWAGHGIVEEKAGRFTLAQKGRFLAEGVLAELAAQGIAGRGREAGVQ
ncbi:MAG TPA: radical SAM family heme chaperone HemW [Verrucomicrobiae bacterium]|nr:radical SAM family heme chaperone HemW [Verrucomicrobiae bacterium]